MPRVVRQPETTTTSSTARAGRGLRLAEISMTLSSPEPWTGRLWQPRPYQAIGFECAPDGTLSHGTLRAMADPPPAGKSAPPEPQALLAAARELLPWMREIRRDFHRHPELGLEEHRTAYRLQALLDELGIEHVDGLGGTGVLGLIPGLSDGPVVALRADMDALPMQDAKEVPYRSQVAGKMHACGHDVHMAILLGAARILMGLADRFPGTVKLIFQPAEETVGGAKLLIEEGVLENPTVDAIFGLHVDASHEVGTFGLHYGQRNASSDNVDIVIHGRSGHGAYPAAGIDAIVVAAQVITALQTVVSRNVDARDSAVVSFGKIQGGSQGNILADRVGLVGTVRCLDPAIRELVVRRVRETAEGVAAAMGGRAEVEIEPSYDPLINDNAMVQVVHENARRLVGDDDVFVFPRPNMGVEDFAYYVSRVPGAFFALGVRNEAAGIVDSVHQVSFDVDERCMAYGAAIQVMNALTVLER
jgi:amidohydrolase